MGLSWCKGVAPDRARKALSMKYLLWHHLVTIVVAGGLASGCSTQPTASRDSAEPVLPAAVVPTFSPPPAGREAFVAYARSIGFGASLTNDQVATIGLSTCRSFSMNNFTFDSVVQAVKLIVATDADGFVRAAVTNLCPEQKVHLP